MRKLLTKCMTASLAFAMAMSGCFITMPVWAAETSVETSATSENDVLKDFDVSFIKKDRVDENGTWYDVMVLNYNKERKNYNSYEEMINSIGKWLRNVYKHRYDNDKFIRVIIPVEFISEKVDNFSTTYDIPVQDDINEVLIDVTDDPDEGEMLAYENGRMYEALFKNITYKNGKYTGNFICEVYRKHTKEEYEAFQAKAKTVVNSLNFEGKSDAQRIYAIYKWISQDQGNVLYRKTGMETMDGKLVSNDQSAYSALMEGGAVCAGISQLAQYLAISAGIETYLSISPEHNHQNTIVNIEQKFYFF